METLASSQVSHVTEGILERSEHGLTVLSPAHGRPGRRVLYVNSYGGAEYWQRIKRGLVAPQHLWGTLELVRMGYEVALAEPLPDFYLYRNPLPHDLRLLSIARSWLGSDGIVYCGHNVLYWLPLLRSLRALRCRIVSLLFAREPLDHCRAHSGIIALTPAAAEHAHKLAPQAKIAHLGWGADLRVFPEIPYDPEFFLSCGRTLRDHVTLRAATGLSRHAIRVIMPRASSEIAWPPNVRILTAQSDDVVTFPDLLREQYAACAGSLIVLQSDPEEYTAVGMTNLIEAMAMGRPVIATRTGALASEIDLEKSGCGFHVRPNDPVALAGAIHALASDPARAAQMGEAGRRLCEQRYNIVRYAAELDRFFQLL